jgi:pimeloyl-ACP methyl ester carboxylesterase
MDTVHDRTLILRDGRTLGWSEYGDPGGRPVFYFHGWPASRKSGLQLDGLGKRFRLRIISPDRPGIGLSTYRRNRTLLDFPSDIQALCVRFKIKRFSMIGASGGAPYVYAVAYKLPEMTDRAIVVAGLGPLAHLAELRVLPRVQTVFFRLSGRLAPLVPVFVFLHRALAIRLPAVYGQVTYRAHSDEDRKAFRKQDVRIMIDGTIREAYRQGTRQAAHDWKLYLSPWGFDLSDIRVPIHLYHGDRDRQVPYAVAKETAALSPRFTLETVRGYGHYLLLTRGDYILKSAFG